MVLKYFFQAYKGKIFWSFLKRRYGDGLYPSRYIVYPSKDVEYNFWGLYYLTDFIKKEKFDNVIILATDDEIQKICCEIKFINLTTVRIGEEKMNCLIRYAALVNRMKEWTIVSVKEPFDTGAERLLGRKGVKKSDIVWYDVFRMSNKPEPFERERLYRLKGLEKLWNRVEVSRTKK